LYKTVFISSCLPRRRGWNLLSILRNPFHQLLIFPSQLCLWSMFCCYSVTTG
jgi:hypothetical protein